MTTTQERRDRLPGQAVPSWHLYEIKMGPNQQQLGTTDLRGRYYEFRGGESLSFVQISEVPGDRVPVIQAPDGKKMLFETWASQQG